MTAATSYLAAVAGATGGALTAANSCAAKVRRSLASGKVDAGFVTAAMNDLVRVAGEIKDVDSETSTSVRLVIASPSSVKQASLVAAGKLRQIAQAASASTGRVESAYHTGNGNVVADASLANVLRAGMTIVYAATEAARQLEVIAGKIKL